MATPYPMIFVFDYDGNNLVSPRQTSLIGENWLGLEDRNGVSITDKIIETARAGGYHSFEWTKPSTGETARMVTYQIGLQDWKWALGTGIFIDDVVATVAAARATTEARIRQTFMQIAIIAFEPAGAPLGGWKAESSNRADHRHTRGRTWQSRPRTP